MSEMATRQLAAMHKARDAHLARGNAMESRGLYRSAEREFAAAATINRRITTVAAKLRKLDARSLVSA
jgi:hypothetical protein